MTATDQAFEEWLHRLPVRALKCRFENKHRFPEPDDRKRVTRRKIGGIIHTEMECLRHCGLYVTTYLSPEGYVVKSPQTHFYDPGSKYLIPKEARDGKGLTREKRARIRAEFLDRNNDWITEE